MLLWPWSLTYCSRKKLSLIEAVKEIKVTQSLLDLLSCKHVRLYNTKDTSQMFLSIQCTWDGVPEGSEPLTHSLSHDAIDEVVLSGHWHHVVAFPVHLLVLLVSHFSGHHQLLPATLYHWGHLSVQGATEIKRVMSISYGLILKYEPNTVFIEIGMLSKAVQECTILLS